MVIPVRGIAEAEANRLGVKVLPHAASWFVRFLGWGAELLSKLPWWRNKWTAWRRYTWITLGNRIYHPAGISDPFAFPVTILHELTHARQQADGLAVWVAKYICNQEFRFKMEAEAFLVNIGAGTPIEDVIDMLCHNYAITRVPRERMRRYFQLHSAAGPVYR